MFDPNQFRDLVIKPTLTDLSSVLPGADHPSAVNLLLGTCWQESRGGTYLKQLGGGPALGVYQVEPATHEDLFEHYIKYNESLWDHIDGLSPDLNKYLTDDLLIYDLRYATIIARLVYYRQSFLWPATDDHIEGLGRIWKKYYNTEAGKGTVDAFVQNFPEL